jgi:hypothetical protein
MPEGLLVTVPEPMRETVRVNGPLVEVNVAVTVRAAVMDMLQAPVPGQEMPLPLHPEKV